MMLLRPIRAIVVRLLATVVVVAAAVYGLTGLKAMRAGWDRPGELRPSAPAMPTPDQLLSAVLRNGFWAFPTGYWTIGQRELVVDGDQARQTVGPTASDISHEHGNAHSYLDARTAQDMFLSGLAESAAESHSLDPKQHFEPFVPLFTQSDRAPLMMGELTVYQLETSVGKLGLVCRYQRERLRVVGGGLLVRSESHRWRVYQLYANPLGLSKGVPLAPTLEDHPAAELLAARFDESRRRIAEFVQLPVRALMVVGPHTSKSDISSSHAVVENLPSMGESTVAHGRSRGRPVYSWHVTRPNGTFKLIVDAAAVDSAVMDR